MFSSELEMSKMFEIFLKSNFGNSYLKEYKGLFGIPDFLFYEKGKEETLVISFELKLYNWRRAVVQAFRYKSFSNAAYVVLPNDSINNALTNIELFENYQIGLASFDQNKSFQILYMPKVGIPYSDILSEKLAETLKGKRAKSKNVNQLIPQ